MEKPTEQEIEQAIILAKANHGKDYDYEVRKGTSVDLRKLTHKQEVCACNIKGHHILMTYKY